MSPENKILVVDDEIGCRESLRLILEDKYQVTTLENGKEALEYIAAEKPDMVLLDLLMPHVDGIEVLRQIKESNSEIEVAIITAYASVENARDALRFGAVDYLIKPFNKEDVEKIVEKGLNHLEERRQVKQSLENSQISKKRLEKKIEKIRREKIELANQFSFTQDYLECLIESSIDALITTDIDGTITLFSKGAEKLYGHEAQEIVGNPFDKYFADNPERIKKLVNELKKTGKLQNQEVEFIARDEKKIPSLLSASFLKDRNGRVLGSLMILRDISEQKKIQQQIIQVERLKALGEMAAGIAHDFNNILSIVLANAQLLELQGEQKGISAVSKGSGIIKRAALDGADVVRRIQEFSRMKKERISQPINLNELIMEVRELTKPRWKNEAHKREVQIEFEVHLDEIPLIAGISFEIKEVFTNLIFNAVDAMPQGGTITISSHLGNDNSFVDVQVSDTGMGMSPETRLKALEPFFTTKGIGNSGLGLSMCYGIIKAHGGRIDIASQEGKGTTFTIHLPVATSQQQEEEEVGTVSDFAGEKILIIEDEEEIGEALCEMLNGVGCQATFVNDGREGLEMFCHSEYDLVITDLGMPEISGWKIAEKTKEINPKIPVILMTGWNVEIDEQNGKENIIDQVISKPFEMNKILQVIKTTLTKQ